MHRTRWILVALTVVLAGSAALADELTDAQRRAIDRALAQQGLNEYGDPQGTMYTGGTPLFDERTGESTDRYEYIMRVHPDLVPVQIEKWPNPDRGPYYAPPADRSSPPPTR
jgi:hypothetical protein